MGASAMIGAGAGRRIGMAPARSRRASRRTRARTWKARAARHGRAADLDHGNAGAPARAMLAPSATTARRAWSPKGRGREQRRVEQRRHADAAQEHAPRERDGGQQRCLMMADRARRPRRSQSARR